MVPIFPPPELACDSSSTPRRSIASLPFRSAGNPYSLHREETFAISGITELNEGRTPRTVKVTAGDVEFDAVVRIDTPGEANYYRNGGIMQYVLRNLRNS